VVLGLLSITATVQPEQSRRSRDTLDSGWHAGKTPHRNRTGRCRGRAHVDVALDDKWGGGGRGSRQGGARMMVCGTESGIGDSIGSGTGRLGAAEPRTIAVVKKSRLRIPRSTTKLHSRPA